MIKEQVDAVPRIANPQPPLPADECEATAELQQKCFEVTNERLFHVGFGILILQPEEFQDERVLELFLRSHAVRLLPTVVLGQHRRFIAGERRALIKQAVYLTIKLSHRPPSAERLGFVELAGHRVFYPE